MLVFRFTLVSRRRAQLLVVALAVALPALAWAHGPTPDATGVFVRASAPGEVVLVTNFGLVASRDGGDTWEWICEESFGSKAVNRYAQGADGALYAATYDGLFRTDGGACAFSAAKGALVDHNVLDVAADPTAPQHVFALGQLVDAGGPKDPVALFESSDGGRMWQQLPALPAGPKPLRVLVSSDGQQLYVWGSVNKDESLTPRILHRAPSGGDFTAVTPAGLSAEAITDLVPDPADSKRVLFIVSGPTEDRLLDGAAFGADPVERLRTGDRLYGIAFGAGKHVWVGAQQSQTLHASDDGGMSFHDVGGGPHYLCLGARGDELWACGDWRGKPMGDGDALFKVDAAAATFTPALSFDNLSMHASECLGDRCAPTAEWLCTFTCSSGDGGLFSPERREVAAPEKPDAAVSDDAPVDGPGEDGGGGGCGCRSARASGGPAAVTSMLAIALAALKRRRERRRAG